MSTSRLPMSTLVDLLLACAEPDAAALAGDNPPEVYLLSPAAESVWATGEPIPLQGVFVDDGTPAEALHVEIASDRDGALGTFPLSADGQLAGTLVLSEGAHVLAVLAADAAGHTSTRAISLTVGALSHPSQPAFAIEPDPPVTGDPLVAHVVAEGHDPEGDPLSLQWTWTVDGASTPFTSEEIGAGIVVAGETWTATLVLTDGSSTSTPTSRSVRITNGRATPDAVWIEPGAPDASTPLTCTTSPPVDPEGDTYTTSYRWWIGTTPLDQTESVLAAGIARRGDTVSCALVTDDGTPATFTSPPVTVGNTAPTLGRVDLAPDAGDTTTHFACTAYEPGDVDRDVVHLDTWWYADNVLVATGPSLRSGLARRDQEIRCEVVPSDSWANGTPSISPTLRLDDAPPGPPSVEIVGAAAGSPVECQIGTPAIDPDGDEVSYTWSWEVDGVTVAGSDPLLATTGLDPATEVTCHATPSDGTRTGPAGSATTNLGDPTRGEYSPADANLTLLGGTAGGQFGKVVDRVSDVDGDGRDELIVGSPRGLGGTRGAVFLYTAATLDAATATLRDRDADAAWVGEVDGDQLGSARGAAGLGDVDGDGRGDLALAAPQSDATAKDAGDVYLIAGGRLGDWGVTAASVAAAHFSGARGDLLGARIAGGDWNGDGIDDLALAAPGNDTAAEAAGAVGVWFGGSSWVGRTSLADADATLTGASANDQLGWSLGFSPDGDGDGYDDLVVGAPLADTNAADAGAAAVVSGDGLSGTRGYSGAAWLVVEGLALGDHLGYDAAGVGDVDGDGLGDAIFGAYQDDGLGVDAGAAGLFYGRAGVNHVVDFDAADLSLAGLAEGDLLGQSLVGAGDFDADGLADFLVGAPRRDGGGSDAGVAWLFLGSAVPTTSDPADAAASITGTETSGLLGDELAGDFDIDGDGYSEFVLGAQGATGSIPGAGAVYLFRGP